LSGEERELNDRMTLKSIVSEHYARLAETLFKPGT
jgi:hypothetical protein